MSATVLPTTPPEVLQTDRRFFDLFPDEREDTAIGLAETLAVQPHLTAGAASAEATAALADAAASLDAVGVCRLLEAIAARDLPAAIAVALARVPGSHGLTAVAVGRSGLCVGDTRGRADGIDTLFPIDGTAPPLDARAAVHLAIAGTALAIGAMQRTVDQVMQYARRRKAFGEPIVKHQAVGMRLADLVIALDGLRLCLYQFASDQERGRNDTATFDVLYRQFDDTQAAVGADALRVMGGHGYLTSAPPAQLAQVLPRLAMLVAAAGAFPDAFPNGSTDLFPRKASA